MREGCEECGWARIGVVSEEHVVKGVRSLVSWWIDALGCWWASVAGSERIVAARMSCKRLASLSLPLHFSPSLSPFSQSWCKRRSSMCTRAL